MSSSILFPTNQYTTSSKSSEQIQKLIVPSYETIDQTLAHIISKGFPSQVPYLYKQMHLAYGVTLSFVCSKAPTEQPENQIIIANSLKTLFSCQGQKLNSQELQMIFECCLECLNNLHSSSNQEMRLVMEEAIKYHEDSKKLIKRLEEVALQLGRPSQPIISKVTSARLISVLAKYMGRMIKGDMIDILKRVLADSQVEAKKVWVRQIFPRLLKNLELQFIELHLQQKIYQLVWDQNQQIGILALEVILKNATRFSIEEQSSRIVKLFIDSLTSKKQRISLMASELMGEAYQKLLHIVLRNEHHSIKFWKSLIQLSQSHNERILYNLAYNLPGLLILSAPLYKVEPLCQVYIELFYQPLTNKFLLTSYFHEIAILFPTKAIELREIIYWMFNQLFEQDDPYDDAVKIINKFVSHLSDCKHLFFLQSTTIYQTEQKDRGQDRNQKYFEATLCDFLMKYLTVLLNKKNSSWLAVLYNAIKDCYDCFSGDFIQQTLLPRLYLCLRSKTANCDVVVEGLVKLISRDSNSALINAYASKINAELSKSSRSYEREIAVLFFYFATNYFSIELFQEYRLGQKYLSFNNDKNFKVKTTFIRYLPRLIYFFTREEKIQYAIIITRLLKDPDSQIHFMMQNMCFTEDETSKQLILQNSRILREKEKEKQLFLNFRKQQIQHRRSSKELKKQDVLKKRIETTKGKIKMLIKDIPKKKIGPVLVKTTSNLNFRKNS